MYTLFCAVNIKIRFRYKQLIYFTNRIRTSNIAFTKKLIYFLIVLFLSTLRSFCVSQAHRHAHGSRTNYELKGINRGTHCKINDLFRIEIMAAAYSRMHIPNVKRCLVRDVRPSIFPPLSFF